MAGFFRWVWDGIKKEIRLTREYYANRYASDEFNAIDRIYKPTHHAGSPVVRHLSPMRVNNSLAQGYTVYYSYGHVMRVMPPFSGTYYENRDKINSATSIVSDGIEYDLTDLASIGSINIPRFDIYVPHKIGEELGALGCLDYTLRMRAGKYWTDNQFDLSMACLAKATEIMKYNRASWTAKDYFRIVNELNDLGRLKEARQWKKWIIANVPGTANALLTGVEQIEAMHKSAAGMRLESCDTLETDLVEVGDLNACCEICAKYRKRIYSLSGKDRRFPKFPEDFHFGCGLGVYAFVEDVNEPSFECRNIVKYSNRPFVDDRTNEEISNYHSRLERINELNSPAVKEPDLARIIYYQIRQQLPEYAPKSINGFLRMRKSNSKNYQALMGKVAESGIVLPSSLEEVEEWNL